VIQANSDIRYQGAELSTLFAKAVTGIVTSQHVYDLPSRKPTATPTAAGTA
jgi:D-alanyl-D-alanine carboxypeptidase